MSTTVQFPDTFVSAGVLSTAVIGPDDQRRNAVIEALTESQNGQIREFIGYPASIADAAKVLMRAYDVVLVDLDSNPEFALDLVEGICVHGSAIVMVYSALGDPDLIVRCMRAGAREFLRLPFTHGAVAEALVRASARRPVSHARQRTEGGLFVFLGSKGGAGVTTLACNYAVALAEESAKNTLLIDLNLPLGDAAINLGIKAQYSTVDALLNSSRLDSSFLSTLLIRYSPSLSVLAAPSELTPCQASNDAVDRLLTLARQEFDYVVVDAGSRMDLKDARFFDDSAILYLITQAGVTELRNANRMIGQFFVSRGSKLQVVVNRYSPQSLLIDDKQIEKALTRSIDWKIPDDYATARRTQNAATPLALEDSSISRAIRRMARKACGLAEEEKESSGILGWARRGFTKLRSGQGSADAKEEGSSASPAHALDPDHAKS
jgi:pilus assembly protein CpaE